MKRKFWNWVRDSDTGKRTLVLNGQIAEESWFGDEVTPAIFRDELMKGEGNILTVPAGMCSLRLQSTVCSWITREMLPSALMDLLPWRHLSLYGYKWDGDQMVIVPDEASVVKRIYMDYMAGKTELAIAKALSESGITTRRGGYWRSPSIKCILKNTHYTGNLLLQKYYVENPLTHKVRKNEGGLPRYWGENTHEAIITYKTMAEEYWGYSGTSDWCGDRSVIQQNWKPKANVLWKKCRCYQTGCRSASAKMPE